MCHRSKSFSCNAIFVNFGLQRFRSLPRGCMRFHYTTTHCFRLFFIAYFRLCIRLRVACLSFTQHRGSHKSFRFFPRNLWISECSLSSGSMKSVFEYCRASFFFFAHSCFSRFWAALPIFVQTSGHTWSGLAVVWIFVSLPPDHIYPVVGFSLSGVNFVEPFHESDKYLLESTVQQSSIRFSYMTSRSVWVDLATSIHFIGIRNVSSGT